jgi:SAM-dependent methyltransferase
MNNSDFLTKVGGSLADRVRDWWYGAENTQRPARVSPVAEPDGEAGDEDRRGRAARGDAPADRLEILQGLWGPGYILPGGPDDVRNMVKPFGVNSAMSLLDLAAGLGGPSRFISKTFDVYITAFERDPEMAARGNAMSVAAGLARKVPIAAYDPETVELRAGAFDAAYAEHLTFAIKDKPRLFRAMKKALKPRGQITFTDFVSLGQPGVEPALDNLRRCERYPLYPWTVKQYTGLLNEIGFDCRITEDQSAAFKTQVIEAWDRALKTYDLRGLSRPQLLGVVSEAELWVYRIAALEAGDLGICRFYAVAK